MAKKGFFITFEGGEGTGKSTQVKLLKEALETARIDTITTREPGGTKNGERIREILVTGNKEGLDPKTDLLLHFAARREHLVKKIWPALENGQCVISDRFADSSRAYQAHSMGLDKKDIEDIYNFVVGDFEPDLTIILDIDPKIGLKRSLKHNKTVKSKEDRYEKMGLRFHRKIRKGFAAVAKKYPHRCIVIDASQDIKTIHKQILKAVENQFKINLKARAACTRCFKSNPAKIKLVK